MKLAVITFIFLITIADIKAQILGSSVTKVEAYISPLGYQKMVDRDVNQEGLLLKVLAYKRPKSDGVTIKQFVFRENKLIVKATASTGDQQQVSALASSYSAVDGRNMYIDSGKTYHYINLGRKSGYDFVIHLESNDKFFLQNFAPSFYQGFSE